LRSDALYRVGGKGGTRDAETRREGQVSEEMEVEGGCPNGSKRKMDSQGGQGQKGSGGCELRARGKGTDQIKRRAVSAKRLERK